MGYFNGEPTGLLLFPLTLATQIDIKAVMSYFSRTISGELLLEGDWTCRQSVCFMG